MTQRSLGTVFLLATLGLFAGGCEGPEGPAGPQGPQGADGADGLDGSDGSSGADGDDGADGTDGADGSDGAAGSDGADGADGSNGSDGADGSPGFASSSWWIAHNGAANAGTASLRSQTWGVLADATTGTNEGVAFDASNNLVQAGDAPGFVAVRTFCDGLMDGDSFTAGRDREIAGAATGLVTPKGAVVAKRAGVVIVANVGDMTLKVFGGAAAGDVAPIASTPLPANAWDLVYDEDADRAFIALVDGTLAVIDGYAAGGWVGPVDRLITPSDAGGTKISTNLHGIDYHADTDTIVVTDVGAATVAQSADFASDGSIYVIANASTATGNVAPDRVIEGLATLLGNPVDLLLDGSDARITEKAQGQLLVFRDVVGGPSGDIAPDYAMAATGPESLARVPAPITALNPSDLVDPATGIFGVFVTSNPADTTLPAAGMLSRLSANVGSSIPAFDAEVPSAENVTFGVDGDAYVSFDDGAATGGVAVLGRMAQRADGAFDTSRDRTITGPNTGLIAPKGLEVVDSLGLLLVTDIGTGGADAGVRVFGSCAAGDVAPLVDVDTAGGRPWDLDHDLASDTLYLAFTNGTVGIYDGFTQDLGAGGPDRVVTPTIGGSTASVNLHGIRYDASTDTLILSDVGDAASTIDGQLFTIAFASQADGPTEVEKSVGGALSGLGNPVDIAYDGQDLYVAEKANGRVLLYRDFLYTDGAGLLPDADLLVTAPESLVLAPSAVW